MCDLGGEGALILRCVGAKERGNREIRDVLGEEMYHIGVVAMAEGALVLICV